MKSYLGKALAFVLSLSLLAVSFAGCHKNTETDDTNTVAAIFEGENIYMDEAKAYIYTTQYDNEVDYAFYIAYYYQGADKYWSSTESGVTLWEVNLTQAMQRIYQTKVLCKAAEAKGMTLTEEQQKKVDDTIDKYMEQEKVGLEYAGADKEMVTKLLTENALANAYYEELIKNVSTGFEEDETRRKKLEGVYIVANDSTTEAVEAAEKTESAESAAESETAEGSEETEAATESKIVNYSDDEKAQNVAEAKEAIASRLQDGAAASDIVEEYKDNEKVSVSALPDEFEPTYKDAVEGDTFESAEQLAWSLSTGEVGSAVFKDDATGEDATYVIYCSNDNDEDLSKTAEDNIMNDRRAELFAEEIQSLMRKYSEFHVFTEKVGTVEYKGKVYESNIYVEGQETEAATEEETGSEETTEETKAEDASKASDESETEETK